MQERTSGQDSAHHADTPGPGRAPLRGVFLDWPSLGRSADQPGAVHFNTDPATANLAPAIAVQPANSTRGLRAWNVGWAYIDASSPTP
jgi:hypothetical protein